jgi:hypothetical protein
VAQAEECLLCKYKALNSNPSTPKKKKKKKKERNSISTNKKLGVVLYIYHPSYVGSIRRRIIVQTSQDINATPYFK